jgi:hypothetical protein
MTPGELFDREEAHQRHREEEWERTAWMVSRLMAAWIEKPPTVDQLLGRRR